MKMCPNHMPFMSVLGCKHLQNKSIFSEMFVFSPLLQFFPGKNSSKTVTIIILSAEQISVYFQWRRCSQKGLYQYNWGHSITLFLFLSRIWYTWDLFTDFLHVRWQLLIFSLTNTVIMVSDILCSIISCRICYLISYILFQFS